MEQQFTAQFLESHSNQASQSASPEESSKMREFESFLKDKSPNMQQDNSQISSNYLQHPMEFPTTTIHPSFSNLISQVPMMGPVQMQQNFPNSVDMLLDANGQGFTSQQQQ